MTKVLVFGDSQVATVAEASKRRQGAGGDISLDFVSAPGPVSHKLRTDGPGLHLAAIPETWAHAYLSDEHIAKWYAATLEQISALGQGKAWVDLSQYDVVVCTGGHLVARWNSLYDLITTPYLSRACVEQACHDMLSPMRHGLWLFGLMATSRPTKQRIFSLPEPLLSEVSPLIATPAYAGKAYRPVEEVMVEVLARMGSSMVRVPPELVSEAGNAASGSFKVGREGDFVHLNHEGGDIMFRSLVDAITRDDVVSA